jgi:pentalenene oxygenase
MRQSGSVTIPGRLIESENEIDFVTAGRLRFVVVNSAELTRLALDKHQDAFVAASAPRSFAWRFLSSGAIINARPPATDRRGASARSFAKALGADADAAAAFAERICGTWNKGDVVDVEKEIAHLTRWVAVRRLLEPGDMPDVADEIGAALAGYGNSTPRPGHPLRHLRSAIERAVFERRTSTAAGGTYFAEAPAASHGGTRSQSERATSIELTNALILSLETAVTVMRTVWPLLTEHPHVRARLQHEIDGLLNGRTPEYRDVRRLRYARQLVREVLRLHPPVALFSRRLAHDVELGGSHLPAGSVIVFKPGRLHRSAEWFSNPHRFDPDRFEHAARTGRLPQSYMPFGSTGSGSAERYALSLSTIVLVTIAQRCVLVRNGSATTVAAVRSARLRHDSLAPRAMRRAGPRRQGGATRPQFLPVRLEAPRHHRTHGGTATAGSSPSLILTCDALRAAL